ncbi:MAG TPA: C25 family cysteine peptidase [Candidatus Anoxymicrobiaceae bacterium]
MDRGGGKVPVMRLPAQLVFLLKHRKTVFALAFLATISLLSLQLFSSAASANSGAPDSTTIPLKFPALQTSIQNGTTTLEMDGCPNSREAGKPVLPIKALTIAAPPGKQVAGVSIVKSTWHTLSGTYNVEWGQPPAPSDGSLPPRAAADRRTYGSDNPYPAKAAEVRSTGYMRRIPLGDLTVSPVRYHPRSGLLEWCSEMEIKVTYSSASIPASLDKADSAPESIGGSVVDNPEQAEQWYGHSMGSTGNTADCVIITTDALASSVTPLVNYRQAQGLSVNVTSTTWITANCSGADIQEKIRNFLRDRYLSWGISYVLIVGSDSSVPMRRCSCDGSTSYDYVVPTDYYYSDLSGNWDLNGDGKYGQYGVDDATGGVDFYPEVMVGRIPFDSGTDVTNYCNKVVSYSGDTGAWKHKVLLPEATSNFQNENSSGWPATFGGVFGERIKTGITNPIGYSNLTMYETAGISRGTAPLSPDPSACDVPLTNANLISRWNEGYGVVPWWGHGNYTGAYRKYWASDDGDGVPEAAEMAFTQFLGNADVLSNTYPAIVFACSCENGLPEEANNLGATVLKNGAIAMVVGSRVTWYSVGWQDEYWGGNSTLDYNFTRHLLSDGGQRVGKALRLADIDDHTTYNTGWGAEAYANLYGFNLYGDPALKLDAEGPPAISTVTPGGTVNTGTANLTIRGNNFVTGAAVKITKAGQSDVIATGVTVDSPTRISCSVNVDRICYGNWNVVVTNPDNNAATKTDGLAVSNSTPTVVPPSITAITPARGSAGTTVTIKGADFGNSRGSSVVSFNGVNATEYESWSETQIVCKVPRGASTGSVEIKTTNGASNEKDFVVTGDTSPVWYLAEGSTDWGFDTYISVINPNDRKVTARFTFLANPTVVKEISMPANSQITVNPREYLGNKDFSTIVECKEGLTIVADRTMIWTGPGAAGPEAHSSIGVKAPSKEWYLAEGSSDWGFETWLLIQNPTSKQALCTVSYMIEGKAPRSFQKVVPANSRASYSMAEDIGSADASIRVSATAPVIVERSMYRNNRREGHESVGTTTPARDYYLAEGTTDWGFTTYVLVQNPGDNSATINITYNTQQGPVRKTPFVMPPRSRKTINVNAELVKKDFSTHVHSDQPVIAERAMYWNNGTGEACHDSIGMAEPHTTFYLPDGETSNGRETWTLVQNPNGSPVKVEISYLLAGGGQKTLTDTIPANSRKTYFMADIIPSGRAAVMVTSKTSGKKVIVERAMYWNGRGAGTDTIGGYSD